MKINNTDPFDLTPLILPEVGLIHMNGRGFDPLLGRFLSVDPFIQSPTNTQSINPYSYIFNNPLSGTDPTGYKSKIEKEKEEAKPNPLRECSASAQKAACREFIKNGHRKKNGTSSRSTNSFTSGKLVDEDEGGSTNESVATNPVNPVSDDEKLNATYEKFNNRVVNHFLNTPDETFEITPEDMESLIHHTRGRVDDIMKEKSFIDRLINIHPEFDTILFGSASLRFSFNGNTFAGGEINYLAAGMLAGAEGWSKKTIRNLVFHWNFAQWAKGGGEHNVRQAQLGFSWAEFGRKSYLNNKASEYKTLSLFSEDVL